ncbi:hypothetical protein SRHO_G00157550 [Serrasalmus rhombeus]
MPSVFCGIAGADGKDNVGGGMVPEDLQVAWLNAEEPVGSHSSIPPLSRGPIKIGIGCQDVRLRDERRWGSVSVWPLTDGLRERVEPGTLSQS